MSNVPPQQGWWMASDGNWYPPESKPGDLSAGAGGQTAGSALGAPVAIHPGWWMASDGNWYPPESGTADSPNTFSPPSAAYTVPPNPVHAPTTTPVGPSVDPLLVARPNAADYFSQRTRDAENAGSEEGGGGVNVSFHPPSGLRSSASRSGTSGNRSVFDEPGLSPMGRGWELELGKGARKGIRTEKKAITYFSWAVAMFVYYVSYFALVVSNPGNLWLFFLSAPGTIAFLAVRTYYRIWNTRAHATKVGVGWTQESPRGMKQLKQSVYLAIAAMSIGFIGNGIFWGYQAVGLFGGSGNNGNLIKLINPNTGQQIGGSPSGSPSSTTSTTANPLQIEQNMQRQLQKSGF